MKSIGIDIGTYSIKVAEVQSSSKSVSLAGFKEYNLSQDPAADKDIEILEILRQIHEQNKNVSELVYVAGVPTVRTSIHRITQPPAPRFKLLESLPFLLSDLTPLDPDETIYDLKILKTHPNGFDTIAVGTKKEVIKKRLQSFRDAGIDPKILSVEGIALNNVFENIHGNPEKSLTPIVFDDDFGDEKDAAPVQHFDSGEALLEIGHMSSTLLVRSLGGLCEVRELSFGGHHITDAICQEYRIHYKEAIGVLQNSGLIALNKNDLSKEVLRLSDTIKRSLEPFLTQLKLSLLEIKSKRQVHVSGLGLLGGTSRLKNLGPYITQNIQVAANPLTGLNQFPELNFQGDNSKQLNVIVALGLALEGVKKPKNPAINLRKKEFAIKNKNLQAFVEKWSYTMQIVAATFVLVLAWTFLRNQWALELSEFSFDQMKKEGSQITGLRPAQVSTTRLNKYIRDAEQRAELIEKLKGLNNYKQASHYIRELHDQAPSRQRLSLDIKDLDISEQKLILEGSVGSTTQLIGLEELLKDLSTQGKLQTRNVSEPGSDGRTEFKYEVQINPLRN